VLWLKPEFKGVALTKGLSLWLENTSLLALAKVHFAKNDVT